MSEKKQQVSRRQFMNYTHTGVGSFMAAGILVPMLRMAVDPVLTEKKHGDFANAGIDVGDITTDPQRIEWKIDQIDGWYESEVTKAAWVYKDDNDKILALSPIC